MSANAIWYEKKDNRFYFDGYPIRVTELGRLVANALIEGAGYIDFDSDATPCVSHETYPRDHKRALSVSYIQQMLQFAGRHGWFWDCLDSTVDHRFDNTSPTPGTRWAEAQEMLRLAQEGFRAAADLFDFANSRLASPIEARQARRDARRENHEAKAMKKAAWERLMPGISREPMSR